jgi:hypothetical protein
VTSPSKSLKAVDFPLKGARSVDGIISYLSRKCGGNVHDKRIVTITSKSVHGDFCWNAGLNAAGLTSNSDFRSKDEPGQWICWDFHEMRVRPTHYTIKSDSLKSWVVESSLDFVNWTEIDRRTNNDDLKEEPHIRSFTVPKSAECRFIRLTQTGGNHSSDNELRVTAFEVFGSLIE